MFRELTVVGAAACLIAGPLILAPQRDISTEVLIHASPARIWAVLADTAAYPAWAQGMRLTGTLVPGQTITHVEGEGSGVQGGGRIVLHPVVLTADPGRELRWFGRVWFPRLFDAEHSFVLRPVGDGTLVVQAEHFRGIALPFYDVRQLIPHFEAVNGALKQRAEQR